MKTSYVKTLAALLLCGSLASCGDKFLETDIYDGIDIETGLNSVENIGYALNGTYYRFHYYCFAGTESTAFGDLASDLTYWNQSTNHFGDIYLFNPTEKNVLLEDVWAYGYKVADNAARIIEAGEALEANVEESQATDLYRCVAEAYALRAYAHLTLVNMFGHQVKVNGQDFSGTPGVVIVDKPIQAYAPVERATVGETYTAILNDLNSSLEYFEKADMDSRGLFYFTPAAVYGLMARTNLYLENWQAAKTAAAKALELRGITELTYTADAYKALYDGGNSNTESFFALDINPMTNWSANSSGTLWSTYSYSPSPWLQSVMADDDVRRAVWGEGPDSTPQVPVFNSGKFGAFGLGGNSAYGTCYLINAPEMFLIQAEADYKLGNTTDAQNELLVVAKRNPAITSVADLGSDFMAFLKDERARELFQEGHRLFDLRRWDVQANLVAFNAPTIDWMVKDFKVSDCVYPIPDTEVKTANAGVTQNEGWASTFPSM